MIQLIGRQPEIEVLTQAFDSEKSEMVAVMY